MFRINRLLLFGLILLLSRCGKNDTVQPTAPPAPIKPPVVVTDTVRYAALFYFANFGDSMFSSGNISTSGDVFINNQQSPAFSPYAYLNFWGKPAWAATHGDGTIKNNYRFYFNGDPNQPNEALLNYHADLISKAGVDLIILDFTNGAQDFANGPTYISSTTALLNTWQKRMRAGLQTPKIAFFVKNEGALSVVETAFFAKYDSALFFNYLGKKLLLVGQPDVTLGNSDVNQPAVPTNGKFANYTTRHCWGLNNTGKCWQFKVNADVPPPPFMYNGKAEQMCAPVATQASYMTQDGINPTAGAIGRSNGAYFQKYMQAATLNKPKFVFIHSWNEWAAQNLNKTDPTKPYLTDLWGTEYSADIEPMAGGHGDFYYQLMKTEIAKFKKN
ncbi:hypothetical protein EZJ43_09230 [Pedobacter changchengzhani]|uniref:GH26 domain-containing protein n=1 Tax=Pedobacter changchengzhani TaxID=2529274 RepID=A0A4R5MKD5_9SPHI|nr:hypothetical protein [Pedobacter changchengzhani]TDG36177.1 hypothetical protein EZJ43_09230 [Pedobacter changchengzhani]